MANFECSDDYDERYRRITAEYEFVFLVENTEILEQIRGI